MLFIASAYYDKNIIVKEINSSFDFRKFGCVSTKVNFVIGGHRKFISLVTCNLPMDKTPNSN